MLSPLEREHLTKFAENMDLRSAVLKLLLHEVGESIDIKNWNVSNELIGQITRARHDAEEVIHTVMKKIDNYKKRVENKDKKNEAY